MWITYEFAYKNYPQFLCYLYWPLFKKYSHYSIGKKIGPSGNQGRCLLVKPYCLCVHEFRTYFSKSRISHVRRSNFADSLSYQLIYQAPAFRANSANLKALDIFLYFLGLFVPGLKKTIAVFNSFAIIYYFSIEYRWLAVSSVVVCPRQLSVSLLALLFKMVVRQSLCYLHYLDLYQYPCAVLPGAIPG